NTARRQTGSSRHVFEMEGSIAHARYARIRKWRPLPETAIRTTPPTLSARCHEDGKLCSGQGSKLRTRFSSPWYAGVACEASCDTFWTGRGRGHGCGRFCPKAWLGSTRISASCQTVVLVGS